MNREDIVEAIENDCVMITDHADEEAEADQLKIDEVYFSGSSDFVVQEKQHSIDANRSLKT